MATKLANITLAGGLTLRTKSMILYSENQLQEAADLLRQAENKLGASAGGIGFMGSPSFVLGAVTTAALFSKWQKNRLSKEAVELFEDANDKYHQALKVNNEYELNQVENIELPDPSSWQVTIFEDLKRKTFIPRPDGKIQFRTIEDKFIWIMWNHVVTYDYIS